MTTGISVMTLALTGAGIVQIYMERIGGMPFMEVQGYLALLYSMRFWSGLVMLAGLALFWDVVALPPERRAAVMRAAA